jgi:transglutaminase-like putative cysteine protease
VRIRGLGDEWRYDPESGVVYGEERRTPPRYTVEADLSDPTAEQMRAASSLDSAEQIDPIYTAREGIDEQIVQLADQIVAGHDSMYDKVLALEEFFHGDEFTYDTQTSSGSGEDALVDFVTRGKTGFCEQFASAMGIMLRAVGIPSRVAMGYTAGYVSGDYRSVTTQNAHAWVEVYFAGLGWYQFDPTPLTDGTTYTPPYASETGSSDPTDGPGNTTAESAPPTTSVNPSAGAEDPGAEENGGGDEAQGLDEGLPWQIWVGGGLTIVAVALTGGAMRLRRHRGQPLLMALAAGAWVATAAVLASLVSWWLSVLVIVLLAAAAPGLVRERRRVARRHQVHLGSTDAATSAWNELIAESRDRGTEVVPTETVRVTARRLAREHSLDDDGKQALRTLVGEVERSWYGGRTEPDPALAPAFDRLMAGLRRNDPIGWKARLLPRSVLRRR